MQEINKKSDITSEKLVNCISIVLSILIIVSSILRITDKISQTINAAVLYPSLFIMTLLNGLKTIKNNRTNGIIILCCAIIILICGILTLLL